MEIKQLIWNNIQQIYNHEKGATDKPAIQHTTTNTQIELLFIVRTNVMCWLCHDGTLDLGSITDQIMSLNWQRTLKTNGPLLLQSTHKWRNPVHTECPYPGLAPHSQGFQGPCFSDVVCHLEGCCNLSMVPRCASYLRWLLHTWYALSWKLLPKEHWTKAKQLRLTHEGEPC